MEKQTVGPCKKCGEMVYCDGGFLGGVVHPDHSITCWACEEKEEGHDTNK